MNGRLSSSSSSSASAASGFSASQSQAKAPLARSASLSVGAAPGPAGVAAVVQKIPSGTPGAPQGAFTLFLRVHSARNLPTASQGVYCKLYVGETAMVNGTAQHSLANLLHQEAGEPTPGTHRVFRTHVVASLQRAHPVWNQKFEVNVRDPLTEILSVRVKAQQVLFSPGIGACAIQLRELALGDVVDQWFPLYKGQRSVGQVRLQLVLSETELPPPVAVPAPGGPFQPQQAYQYQPRPAGPPAAPPQRKEAPFVPPQYVQRVAAAPQDEYPRPAPTMSVADILKRRDQWQQPAATANQDAVRAEEEASERNKMQMQQREMELERDRRTKEEMQKKMQELKIEYKRQRQQQKEQEQREKEEQEQREKEEQEQKEQRQKEQKQKEQQQQREAEERQRLEQEQRQKEEKSNQQDDTYGELYWHKHSGASTVDSERSSNNQDEELTRAIFGSQRDRVTLDSGDYRRPHDSMKSDGDKTIDYYVSDEDSRTPPASFAAERADHRGSGSVHRSISSVVHDALPSSDSSEASSSDDGANPSSRRRKLTGGKSSRSVGKKKTPKHSPSSSSDEGDGSFRRHSMSARSSKNKKKHDDYIPVGIPSSPSKGFAVPQPKPGSLEYDLYYPVETGSMLDATAESTRIPMATPAPAPPDFAALMGAAAAQQQAAMAEFMKAATASASASPFGAPPGNTDLYAQIAAQQKQYQEQFQETMMKMMAQSNPQLAQAMAAMQSQQQRGSIGVPGNPGTEAAAVVSNSADSSADSSEDSSEDERRQRRKLKKLKRKMKKMKRKAKRRAAKAKRAAEGGADLDSDSDSDSSSSSSLSSSSEEERRKRKAKKKAKDKMRSRSENDALRRSQQSAANGYAQTEDHARLFPSSYASAPALNQPGRRIQSMAPHEIQQQQPKVSLGDVLNAASNAASLVSDVTTIASNIQSLTGGGGDSGGSMDAIGAAAGVSQFFGASDLANGLNIGDVVGQMAANSATDGAAPVTEYYF